jgi:hypothetical protein
MEYKRFTVKTIEREPGKWRASVQRTNGRPLWAGRAKIRHFVTGIDATTPQRAMQMALAATDRGAFSRETSGSHGRQMHAAPSIQRGLKLGSRRPAAAHHGVSPPLSRAIFFWCQEKFQTRLVRCG